jgi:hypothetical protein
MSANLPPTFDSDIEDFVDFAGSDELLIDAFIRERCTTESDDLIVKPLRITKVNMLLECQAWYDERKVADIQTSYTEKVKAAHPDIQPHKDEFIRVRGTEIDYDDFEADFEAWYIEREKRIFSVGCKSWPKQQELKRDMTARGFLDKQVLHEGTRTYCFLGLRLKTPEELEDY